MLKSVGSIDPPVGMRCGENVDLGFSAIDLLLCLKIMMIVCDDNKEIARRLYSDTASIMTLIQ